MRQGFLWLITCCFFLRFSNNCFFYEMTACMVGLNQDWKWAVKHLFLQVNSSVLWWFNCPLYSEEPDPGLQSKNQSTRWLQLKANSEDVPAHLLAHLFLFTVNRLLWAQCQGKQHVCNAVTLSLMHDAPCLCLVKTLAPKSICSGSTEFNISVIR